MRGLVDPPCHGATFRYRIEPLAACGRYRAIVGANGVPHQPVDDMTLMEKTMTTCLSFLTDISKTLAVPVLVGLGYLSLIVALALVAVFSSKPHRRKAALEVLRLLVPARPGSS